MYFPKIARRTAYKTKKNGERYATYSAYYEEIAEDCQHRCVYCDVLVVEVGGESMNLDHFRPKNHFPELENDPCNLVLACPKCNQLKSDWWPEKDGTAQDGLNGFVDPFNEHLLDYFRIDEGGNLESLRKPSQYMIDLMALNRPTRRHIRRARSLRAAAFALFDQINAEISTLSTRPSDEVLVRLPILSDALVSIRQMLAEA
ncbi:HNH endonuclease [Collimonas fungivorans]|uniref:HNH endonuclease n=1 Tax=Collimonas fungivorans TaxID=158899 RepID=UPI000B13F52B|nr:HNH endonuclease signature motif containing protein [Collimonas fungivorans]